MTAWRGVQLDDRAIAMAEEMFRLAGFEATPSQGAWSGAAASAGTHSGCGAIDFVIAGDKADRLVLHGRQVGFLAYHRYEWEADWVEHVHMIAIQPGGKWDQGCLSDSAHRQVIDYFEGRNGLANGAADNGPRQYVGVTWEQYVEDNMITQQDIDKIAAEVVDRLLRTKLGGGVLAEGARPIDQILVLTLQEGRHS